MKDPEFRVPWRWAAGMGVLLAVILAIVAFRGPSGVPVSTARAARKDLVVPILSDGSLEPPAGGELRAPEAATVAAIPAREGERVAKGAPLVVLQSPELTQAALQARSTAAELSEERIRAAGDLEQQKRETARAKETFEADARLVKESAIPRATYETDELAYRQAVERLRVAQARFESLAGSGAGRSRLELAEASARELERRVAALTVTAPTEGIVYGLPRKTGETVSRRTGRRERRRPGAPARAGPRGSAGPPARRRGPAADRHVRRPARPAMGGKSPRRVPRSARGRRPRGGRGAGRDLRQDPVASSQRVRQRADRDGREAQCLDRPARGSVPRRRPPFRLPSRRRPRPPARRVHRPRRLERRRDRRRACRKTTSSSCLEPSPCPTASA